MMARSVGYMSLTPRRPGLDTEDVTSRRIVFLIFDGFQPLDLVGPHEVFSHAGVLSPDAGYVCQVAARSAGPVRAASGLLVHAGYSLADLDPAGVDTVVAVGGCRVTSHWGRAEQLAAEHPEVTVDCDPIFIRDGRVWTSAGVTAGMDLALALVEDDLGPEVARDVARYLVLYLRRPGSQSQFSVPLWTAQPSTDPIRAAVSAVHADPGARHGVTDLAAHAGLSPRHLQRRFTAELGMPPASYVEQVRIEAARRGLAEGEDPVHAIARRCGFGTAETLRSVFQRHLGLAPTDYRDRFRITPVKEVP